jgi:hypothetical protein
MQPASKLGPDKATIICLLIIAAVGALLPLSGAIVAGWLPAWAGAAVSVGALLGMLLVAWRARALRTGLLLLFIAVLGAVALYGWLFASHG